MSVTMSVPAHRALLMAPEPTVQPHERSAGGVGGIAGIAGIQDRHEFAERLGALRSRSGCSFRALGRAVGLPPSTVSGWTTGKHLPYPRQVDVFRQLVWCLGASAEEADAWADALRRVQGAPEPSGQVVAFSGDGSLLAVGAGRVVHVWDVSNRSAPRLVAGPFSESVSCVSSIEFLAGTHVVVIVRTDGTADRWDCAAGGTAAVAGDSERGAVARWRSSAQRRAG